MPDPTERTAEDASTAGAHPRGRLRGLQPIRLIPAFLPLRALLTLLIPPLFPLLHLPVRWPALLWSTLALALLSTAAFYWMERRGLLAGRRGRWALPAVDLLLVTLLLAGSCGASSPFFPLYYVPIVYAGLLGSYPGGLLAGLAASSAYGLLYAVLPSRPEATLAAIVALLYPAAGAISGHIGHYLARLNARGQDLLEHARQLHHQVEERRVTYERWYRAVDRLKADFVYSASHELRTPLTPVKGYLQIMLTPGLVASEEKVREYMQIMANNVDLLTQLVDDIIYLQRVTRIPIDLEEVVLSRVARQALEEVASESEESQVQIVLEDHERLPTILGSGDSLKLVLANLLEAAIRDSPAGSEVRLALRPADEGVDIRVGGAGQGIPTEQQERIFDLFFHADSSPTYVLGREGLSLAVARYIVEMHGGTIAVENQPRGGIVFMVHLPGRMYHASGQASADPTDYLPGTTPLPDVEQL